MAEAEEAPIILYIEDSYQTRKVVTEELRSRGYVVEAVGTAAKAMEALSRLEPDAILSDYLMPGMTGIEFFTELRKNDKFVNIPVVFLTSHIERNAMLRALQMGAEMYLQKPCSMNVLIRVLEGAVRKARKGRSLTQITSTGMDGNLRDFSMADLLQTIEMTRKSGLLEIEQDTGRSETSGMIYFKDGAPIYAEYDKFEGDNAIFRMLPIKSGAYRFFPKDMPTMQKNVKRNVMSLLLEGARRSDEGRISGGMPAFMG